MKHYYLSLLLLCTSAVSAQDGEEPSDGSREPKKGDTIWLEEKISPTTTWIESLVKPFTEWMEEAIQEPERDAPEIVPSPATGSDTKEVNENASTDALKPQVLISKEQAQESAKELIGGDVLYIKLVSKTNQYRVKLISKLGEVRVIYIDASSGELAEKGAKISQKSSNQAGAKLESQTETSRSEAP